MASIPQLPGTLLAQTGKSTTDSLNEVFFLPPFPGTYRGEVIGRILGQDPYLDNQLATPLGSVTRPFSHSSLYGNIIDNSPTYSFSLSPMTITSSLLPPPCFLRLSPTSYPFTASVVSPSSPPCSSSCSLKMFQAPEIRLVNSSRKSPTTDGGSSASVRRCAGGPCVSHSSYYG